jgi:hypothetical protein
MMFSFISTLFSSKLTLFVGAIEGNACIPNGFDFLGLKAWYYYLPQSDFDGCNVRTFNFLPNSSNQADLPLILLAIIDDLLTIAGIVAIAFVIMGAFRYVTSQGNPEDTAKAQSTIINALVGTAIAITAAVFVNFLGKTLGG